MVYDSADRIAMQQDGNLRVRKRWLRFTYDAFGRVLEQSLVEDSEVQGAARRDTLQAAFDTGSAPDLYTMADATLIYRHMYDEYPADLRKELDFANLPALTEAEDERTVGLPVYEKLAVLNENGVDGYRERVFYYDSKGRAIQRVECDEDGDNLLRISNKYDFAGNIVAQRESYTYGGKTDDLDRTFSYDTRDRLVKETARLNNGEQAVVNHTYDDLGQLTGKTYGTGVYAIHETGETTMSTELIQATDSPYNTYLYQGLPPGPICNPGMKSIEAALNPEQTGYYYFALDMETKSMRFFATLAEHEAFVATQDYG